MAQQGSKSTKKKKGNKHATNLLRHDRKYKRARGKPEPGKCGSRFCSPFTGCEPWK